MSDGQAMRVMLDSNVYDEVIADEKIRELVQKAVDAGRLTLVSTHVQMDELERASESKRSKLLELHAKTEQVATDGALWDTSTVGRSFLRNRVAELSIGFDHAR